MKEVREDMEQNHPTEASQDSNVAVSAENAPVEEQSAASTDAESAVQEASAGKKCSKKVIASWVVLGVVVGACAIGAAVFSGKATTYRTKFFPNSSVNGHDVSNLTAEEARKVLSDNLSGYSLTIIEKDGATEILTAEAMGWYYDDKNRLDALISAQDAGHWYRHLKSEHAYEAEIIGTFDTEAADQAIMDLSCIRDAVTPEDAYLKDNGDGTMTAVPEVVGSKLDEETATDLILEALTQGAPEVDLTQPDCYIYPEVTLANSTIEQRAEDWNRYLVKRVVVPFGEQEEILTSKEHIVDDGESVTLETDWIDSLVMSWAVKYNTYGAPRNFTTRSGEKIVIPAKDCYYGWYLDAASTTENVKQALINGDEEIVSPVWLREWTSWEKSDLTDTYLEISIREQKMWCVVDGNTELEVDVVTGNPNFGRGTATGIFTVSEKTADVEAPAVETRGNMKTSSFELLLENGPAIADASWRSAFGGNIYETDGTHGTVYASEEQMKAVFEIIEPGCNVVIY